MRFFTYLARRRRSSSTCPPFSCPFLPSHHPRCHLRCSYAHVHPINHLGPVVQRHVPTLCAAAQCYSDSIGRNYWIRFSLTYSARSFSRGPVVSKSGCRRGKAFYLHFSHLDHIVLAVNKKFSNRAKATVRFGSNRTEACGLNVMWANYQLLQFRLLIYLRIRRQRELISENYCRVLGTCQLLVP